MTLVRSIINRVGQVVTLEISVGLMMAIAGWVISHRVDDSPANLLADALSVAPSTYGLVMIVCGVIVVTKRPPIVFVTLTLPFILYVAFSFVEWFQSPTSPVYLIIYSFAYIVLLRSYLMERYALVPVVVR